METASVDYELYIYNVYKVYIIIIVDHRDGE